MPRALTQAELAAGWLPCPCGVHAWTWQAALAAQAPHPRTWTWCDALMGQYPMIEDLHLERFPAGTLVRYVEGSPFCPAGEQGALGVVEDFDPHGGRYDVRWSYFQQDTDPTEPVAIVEADADWLLAHGWTPPGTP